MSFAKHTLGSALAGLFCLFVATSPAQAASLGQTVVAAPDRTEDDRKEDERRHPAELVDFSGVKPGMTVLDMMAGGGYTTEVFARAVGASGKVYAQAAPGGNDKAKAALTDRAKKPGVNIVAVESPIESPIPADVHNLDMITLVLNYHDITFMPVDRAKMDKALFDGLKHGGSLIIVDHAAKAGDGATVGKTLHRIEESTLISEVEAAGFKKAAEGDFLRVPTDPHDQPFFKMEGRPTDQFVLKFTKP
jgi:predicted methyltransferase